MKKAVSISLTILLLFTMAFSLTGCGTKGDIKDTVKSFEKACNELDFNGVLDCIHPTVSGAIKVATNLAGFFADTNSEEMFDKLSEYLSDSNFGGKEYFSSLKIDVKNIEVEETTAKVYVTFKYKVNDKESERDAIINCTVDNEKWYITTISFN